MVSFAFINSSFHPDIEYRHQMSKIDQRNITSIRSKVSLESNLKIKGNLLFKSSKPKLFKSLQISLSSKVQSGDDREDNIYVRGMKQQDIDIFVLYYNYVKNAKSTGKVEFL